MIKKIVIVILINVFLGLGTSSVYALHVPPGATCNPIDPADHCNIGYSCLPVTGTPGHQCLRPQSTDTIGKISAPLAIQALGIGNIGISKFLNNLVTLIYILATVVLVFMFLWGSLEWLTSGGDKEAVGRARGRIINALVGIILFGVAYAILRLLGTFTGFTFFQ